MKKALVIVASIGLTVASHAQGTIQFGNSSLSRLLYQDVLGGPINTVVPTGTHVGAYWGTDAAGAAAIVGMGRGTLAGPTALTGAGGLWPATGGAIAVYPVAGTLEGQRVWLKIAAWVGGDAQFPDRSSGATYYGESMVVNVVLGPTAGPGTVVWQSASGIHTERAKPFVLFPIPPIPEPSAMVIGLLGLGVLFLRRKGSF